MNIKQKLDQKDDLKKYKYIIVGSGFFGAVIAERIAEDLNEKVAIIEKRDHFGGNSYSYLDKETGIECHKYGTHIFHAKNKKVWDYICQFTAFNNYHHIVRTVYKDKIYPMPINLDTINCFFGTNMNSSEAMEFIESEIKKENILNPSNLEERAISLVGRRLYEAFIKGYTKKQWQTDPKELPMEIIERLPVRFNNVDSYFEDEYQGLPVNGYSELFSNLLNHPNIDIYLNTEYFEIKEILDENCLIIFTGPIDRFFDYKYGELGWRTLRFEEKVLDIESYQNIAVMNYSEENIPYTRIHEFKHLHQERKYGDKTILFYEYSKFANKVDEPYYPINTRMNKELYLKYRKDAENLNNILFGGRLGSYEYLNMDKAIEKALDLYENVIKRRG